ncbi:MAG: type II toxin-antitoxin system RelE/ParE family toxin [Lysobacterales bacterium]
MTLPIVFRRVARSEFLDAANWYESQRAGLGVEFIAEIDRCITRLAEHPDGLAMVRPQIRRITAQRFPFSVYFRIETSRIVVLAVFHGRRDPLIWQGRA